MIFALTSDLFDAWQALEQGNGAPSARDRLDYSAAHAYARPGVSAGVATIEVAGVLTKHPDLFAMLIGGANTTYTDIARSLDAAESDSSVSRILLDVDSGGGSVDGLFELVQRIQAVRKPISVRARNANSAAFVLAAVAGPIEATDVGASFGSIGVATALRVNDGYVHLASTDAPHKRPDPQTADGQASIRERLDAIHRLMVDTIRTRRNLSDESMGAGGVFLAGEAMRRGLIDAVGASASGSTTAGASFGAALAPDVQQTLATIRDLKTGKVHGSNDLGAQVVSIMKAKRAGNYTPPAEPVEQLTSEQAAAKAVAIMKAKRSGNQ